MQYALEYYRNKMTRVINIKSGYSYDIYIGRQGKDQDGYFGNPYVINARRNRDDCIEAFISYFYNRLENDPDFKINVERLRGKTLGCFCKPQRCHGDIIAQWLDKEDDDE